MTETADVAVVGAGIVGTLASLALQERGAKTILVERDRLACGTTANSFAWINATAKTENEAYHRLNAAGVTAWHELASEFGDRAIGLHGAGSLHWGDPSMSGSVEAHRHRIHRLRDFGYPVLSLSGRDMQALEPDVHFGEHVEGLLAPADRWVDAPVAAHFFVDRFRSIGGTVHEQNVVTGFLRNNGSVDGLETNRGRISAGTVVIAAGVDTPSLSAMATGTEPENLPVGAVPGLIVETPPQSDRTLVHHIIYPPDTEGFHVRPTASGGLSIGADDVDAGVGLGADSSRVDWGVEALLERSRKLVPRLSPEQLRPRVTARIGVRPMPVDNLSVVGPLPEADGVYVLVTHSGITLAPVLGPLLAEAVTGGIVPPVLTPFQPGRFASLST